VIKTETTPSQPFLRVSKGQLDTDELAALTMVLLALARTVPVLHGEPAPSPPRTVARWRRPERSRGFSPACSWRAAA
jgi:hypothetical protein